MWIIKYKSQYGAEMIMVHHEAFDGPLEETVKNNRNVYYQYKDPEQSTEELKNLNQMLVSDDKNVRLYAYDIIKLKYDKL